MAFGDAGLQETSVTLWFAGPWVFQAAHPLPSVGLWFCGRAQQPHPHLLPPLQLPPAGNRLRAASRCFKKEVGGERVPEATWRSQICRQKGKSWSSAAHSSLPGLLHRVSFALLRWRAHFPSRDAQARSLSTYRRKGKVLAGITHHLPCPLHTWTRFHIPAELQTRAMDQLPSYSLGYVLHQEPCLL